MREVSNPLGVIDELFSPFSDANDSNSRPPREWREKAHFIRALELEDEENFEKVPCLNEAPETPQLSLVRYRCMVQDVFEPEWYATLLLETEGESGEGGASGSRLVTTKYREVCSCQEGKVLRDLGRRGLGTRGAYYCVPLPAESSWARLKDSSEESPQAKRPKHGSRNFPLPWEEDKGVACVVKLYDDHEELLKVCDTVEILGVLCHDPLESPCYRLHGLVIRKLPFYHPMLAFSPQWLSEERLASAFQRRLPFGAVQIARQNAHEALSKALGNDALAAEYVLALLISRVYGHSGSMPLGRWSLNISRWGAAGGDGVSVAALVEAISQLVPRVLRLPVTAEALCQSNWRPWKDFDANRLRAGQLQLASGTLLVLDECGMTPGNLDERGVRATQAIEALASDQLLVCDFNSYEVQIPLEVNCLFISQGTSIFKPDLVLPLQPSAPSPPSPASALSASAVHALRFWLGLVTRRTQALRVPPPVMAAFSEDFARLRSRGAALRQQTLHAWVALARAVCFTHGEDELTVDRWRSVFAMEEERCRRLAASS